MPSRAKHQVGVEAEQAVTPSHRAPFDGLEQKVAASRLDQLERGADRRFRVGDQLAPDERRRAGGKPVASLGGILGQRTGQGGAYSAWAPVSCARTARI